VPAGVGHAAEAWTNKHTGASVAYVNRGRNDENVTRVTASINFSFTAAPVPNNDTNTYFNGLVHGPLVSPAVRNRLSDLGLTGTVANSGNVTGAQYCQPDADVLLKAMKGYNNYFKRFGILDPGYSGQIKEDRPDFIAGGTYSNQFRIGSGAAMDGRMIATGGWGGRGTLHGWNERIELDGMVDFAKRHARTFAEYAAGVPHTWEASGAPAPAITNLAYVGFPGKRNLAYVVSNDVVGNIYIKEETVAKVVISNAYSNTTLPRAETTEILFARKFKMVGLNTTPRALTLSTKLINADGTDKSTGKIHYLAKVGAGDDLTSTWNLAATGTDGKISYAFLDGGVYDQISAADQVEVSVIALVVTDGASVPLSFSAADTDADENGKIRDHVKDEIRDTGGCNTGFALLALLAIPFVVRRRK
jgi:Synergist-CTERM protein sorting domain-containing protein